MKEIRTEEDAIQTLRGTEQLDQVRGGNCLDEVLFKGDAVAAILCVASS